MKVVQTVYLVVGSKSKLKKKIGLGHFSFLSVLPTDDKCPHKPISHQDVDVQVPQNLTTTRSRSLKILQALRSDSGMELLRTDLVEH